MCAVEDGESSREVALESSPIAKGPGGYENEVEDDKTKTNTNLPQGEEDSESEAASVGAPNTPSTFEPAVERTKSDDSALYLESQEASGSLSLKTIPQSSSK